MPVEVSRKQAVAVRRQQVAELFLQSRTQTEIARELGVAQSTVSADLKALHERWRATALRDFDAARAVELKKLQRIEREAWQAWQRSQEPLETTKVTQVGEDRRAEKSVRHQHGDPRYLEIVHRCIMSRRALMGLDAPTRVAPTSPDGDEAYHSHVMAEIMRLAETGSQGPVVIDAEYVERQLQETQDETRENGTLEPTE